MHIGEFYRIVIKVLFHRKFDEIFAYKRAKMRKHMLMIEADKRRGDNYKYGWFIVENDTIFNKYIRRRTHTRTYTKKN